MITNLTSYISNFDGGAKSYLFKYIPSFPDYVKCDDKEKLLFYVKSLTLPQSSFEEISTELQGITFKTAGKRTFSTWTVNFNVDKELKIKEYFENWQNGIYDIEKNEYINPPYVYMKDQYISLLDDNVEDNEKEIKYTLFKAWPSTISDITLDYSGTEIASFTVTFTYQYFKKDK